jgi:hypothetical protein
MLARFKNNLASQQVEYEGGTPKDQIVTKITQFLLA